MVDPTGLEPEESDLPDYNYVYSQSEGKLYDRDGNMVDQGYSGHGEGVNNPEMKDKRNIGPIPRGLWKAGAQVEEKMGRKGVYTRYLEPMEGNSVFDMDRDANTFYMHGDNGKENCSASEGCMILKRNTRANVVKDDDIILVMH